MKPYGFQTPKPNKRVASPKLATEPTPEPIASRNAFAALTQSDGNDDDDELNDDDSLFDDTSVKHEPGVKRETNNSIDNDDIFGAPAKKLNEIETIKFSSSQLSPVMETKVSKSTSSKSSKKKPVEKIQPSNLEKVLNAEKGSTTNSSPSSKTKFEENLKNMLKIPGNLKNAISKLSYKRDDFHTDAEYKEYVTTQLSNEDKSKETAHEMPSEMKEMKDVLKLIRKEKQHLAKMMSELNNIVLHYDLDTIVKAPIEIERKVNQTTAAFETRCRDITKMEKMALQNNINDMKDDAVLDLQQVIIRQQQDFNRQLKDQRDKHELQMTDLKNDFIKFQRQQMQHSNTQPYASKPPVVQSSNPTKSSNNTKPFGPVPSSSHNHQPTLHQFIDRNKVKFMYQGDKYTLEEKEFMKNSPKLTAPLTEEDGLSLYNQIQKNALIYNIMLTPIDQISIWDADPASNPTTCAMQYDHTTSYYQAYQRSATALYNKLHAVNFPKDTTVCQGRHSLQRMVET